MEHSLSNFGLPQRFARRSQQHMRLGPPGMSEADSILGMRSDGLRPWSPSNRAPASMKPDDSSSLGKEGGILLTCLALRQHSREMTLLCSPRMTNTTPSWWRFCPWARAYSCHTANPLRAKASPPRRVSALPDLVAWSRKLNALGAPSARMTENRRRTPTAWMIMLVHSLAHAESLSKSCSWCGSL
jgi:hypothetical protein